VDRLGPGKKPTREPTIASCRVARCPNSFRGITSACVSNRENATRWDPQRRYGTTKIALRIRRLQVRILPSAPDKSRSADLLIQVLDRRIAP
jgi:hypothetical protein